MRRVRIVPCACAVLIVLGVSAPADVAAAADRAGRSVRGSARAGWFDAALEEIRRSEYRFSPSGGGWTAPNRAHDLRARVDDTGIGLTSRTRGAAAWSLGLRPSGWGREGAVEPVPPGRPSADGGRAEIDRGLLTEWYVNDERGLEQGFTLVAPPRDGGPDGPAVLEMLLEGDLRAVPAEDGRAIFFEDRTGVGVLRYSHLEVRDAAGRLLPARLSVGAGRLRILVADQGAAYPIVVDPLLTSHAWTETGGSSFDRLGLSVATAGDVNGDGYSDVVIGADSYDAGQIDEGGIFVYHGSASGPSLLADWSAQSDQASAHLGAAVSSAGDVNNDGYDDLIAGAPQYTATLTEEGRAFLWLGGASGLGPDGDPANADWTASGGQANAAFGSSVAPLGDVNGNGRDDVIVGAPWHDAGSVDEGRAYVFLGVASGLAVLPAWQAESNQDFGFLGASVASAGDVNADGFDDVLVGAYGYTDGSSGEGAAFFWYGASSFGTGLDGTPANASWSAQSDNDGAHLGSGVAPAGDVDGDGYADVIIGAPDYTNGQTFEGGVFVWLGGSAGLGPVGTPANADWRAEPDQSFAAFGRSVTTGGDVNGDGCADLLVGAPGYEDSGLIEEGKAFAWYGGPAGLGPSGTPSNADWARAECEEEFAYCGMAVSAAGDVNGDGFGDVIVSAPFKDAQGVVTDSGQVWLYYGSPEGPATSSPWIAESNLAGARFGTSVASAGDVNGDGYGDVIVGSPFYDAGETDEGRVFVFVGGPDGPPATAAWTAESDLALSQLGFSVASAGDTNGDGYSDIVVGAPLYEKTLADQGRILVWFGGPPSPGDDSGLGPSGDPNNADWVADADQAGAQLGYAVAPAGDVNRDGYADLIAGAPFYDDGQLDEGRAFVFVGSFAGPAGYVWTGEGDVAGARFGSSAASAGDVNGDGHSDVIVGAPRLTNGETDEGRAYVFFGEGGGVSASPPWTVESNQAPARLGSSVASAGDVDGDGRSDVLVGAPAYSNGAAGEGAAFLWLGSSLAPGGAGDPNAADWRVEGGTASWTLGSSVASAGDVDADGFSDVLIGAREYDNVQTNEGAVFVWFGAAGFGGVGTVSGAGWSVESNQSTAFLGTSVAPAGDVNGDGYGDVLLGAPEYTAGQTDEGRAYIYYGNGGKGLDKIPRQARADDASLLDVLGKSSSTTSFRLRVQARTPRGRGKVRLQWEVEPLGAPFDGAGLAAGSAVDTGPPVAPFGSIEAISQIAGGLLEGRYYRWRVRVLTRSPFFPRSPWMHLPRNAPGEADLRTAGCVDLDGDGYGAPGDPGCAGGSLADCNDGTPRAYPGFPEVCDALDNDCDGTVDGFATTCGAGQCASTGICTWGVDSCTPGPASPETCDGADNDCDGTVDSFATTCGLGQCAAAGFCTAGVDSCSPGPASAEVCDGQDNDCDGVVPADEVDFDGDMVSICAGDCDDANPLAVLVPGPVTGVSVEDLGGGAYRIVWDGQDRAGLSTVYDVYSGPAADVRGAGDFSTGECSAEDLRSNVHDWMGTLPAMGEATYFMFRAQNACPAGTGTWGTPGRDAGAAASARPCL